MRDVRGGEARLHDGLARGWERCARSLTTLLAVLATLWLVLPHRAAAAAPPPTTQTRGATAIDALEDLHVEPRAITFAPGSTLGYEDATIRLRNGAAFTREIDSIRVSGGDWMGFEIAQDLLPDRLKRGADVTLRLRARPNHFVDDTDDRFAAENYRPLRQGRASLDIVVDGETLRVPLHFQPAPHRGLAPAAWTTVLAGLLLFLVAAFWMARGRTPSAARAPRQLGFTQPEAVAAIFVLAFLPYAPAALDGTSLGLDASSILRANAGLGGTRVYLDPTGLGAAMLLGAWTWMLLRLGQATSSRARRTREGVAFRTPAIAAWLGLLLAGFAAGFDASSPDLGRIMVAQLDVAPFWFADALPEALHPAWRTPRWLGFTSPGVGLASFATILATCAATARASSSEEGAGGAIPNPTRHGDLGPGARALVDLAAAATLVTLVWGGPTPVPLDTVFGEGAASVLCWGVIVLLVKSLLLVGIGRGLSRGLERALAE